ncbi:MAG TPA: S8 family serine peptidase [Thermoleophilaceae bacterium]|jgi:hypothetical protein
MTAAMTRVAVAEFPYSESGGDKRDFKTLRVPKGAIPKDLPRKDENVWKFSATPEENNFPVNLEPRELFGVRGGHVVDADATKETAWTVTTGRPDVKIAVLDSGFRWNANQVLDLRFKTFLNRGELPQPNHSGPDLVGGVNCGSYANAHDANGDNVFNLLDYACDSRVRKDTPKNVRTDVLDPQDLLIAFSDGSDADGNGFADDMVGWDFLDDDNDPFDDVQYDHGTGEAEGSSAEANNDAEWVGTCPNCMAMHMRVGDSFVADDNDFAQATLYAVDNGALVIQEALGTLNNTQLAQRAIDYAYNHGVIVIASAADEAAQHHNYPSSHEHTLVVNSVTKYMSQETPDGPPRADVPIQQPRSYVSFNGCTNFSSKIGLAIPSTSCSSDAVGVGAGMAGLVLSAALNGVENGKLRPHPTCRRADGSPCPLSANEVRQVMASGTFAGQTQPDDVNFNQSVLGPQPEPSCSPEPAPGCTDPNLYTQQQVNGNRPIVSPPDSRSYPARAGHDQFYGWGRINTFRSVRRAADGQTAPEVEITSPEWYAQVDPAKPTAQVDAQVWARGAKYSCKVYVAPGSYPNNHFTTDSPPGDFAQVPSPVCDGQARTEPIDGVVAALDVNALKERFPADAGDFRGPEPGHGAGQTSNGRPNAEPYGFTVRVIAESAEQNPGLTATGEDRRNLFLHRDQDMLDGFPKRLPSDGESSPAFADLDGDNRNELVFGTADGWVHAIRPDGSEAKGWPVRTDPLPLHAGGRAFASGEVPASASHGAVLSSPAVADLDRDGSYEVVIADFEGKVYAWSAAGRLVWRKSANPEFSGKPLAPFENARVGERNRTRLGFLASPVAADLDRDDGGRLEVVLAAMDRHVYALNDDGSGVPGYPILVVDLRKVKSIDPRTHQVTFDDKKTGGSLQQGAIVDTPAVGNIAGDARPEIVVGTNEEYAANQGDEGPANISGNNAATAQAVSRLGQELVGANTRLFAIKPEGDRDGKPATGDWVAPGWPAKMALLLPELLPVVGEGVTGNPAIGPVNCPSGGAGSKVGAAGVTGVAYVFNGDGTSCVGRQDGRDTSMDTDGGNGSMADRPAFPALGHPAFGDIGGGVSLLSPVAGLTRALDLLLTEYQNTGQDGIAVWDPASGRFRQGFPARMNDLQFLTGPSVANVDAGASEEVVAASAHLDLQAYSGSGQPVARWPKLTSDWVVANPLIGTFGTLDSDPAARRVVVSNTRGGSVLAYRTDAPACQSGARPLGSWPRFHHDLANSGDYSRDASNPGAAGDVKLYTAGISLRAPGDDLMCGKVAGYELVQPDRALTGATFEEGDPIPVVKRAQDLAVPGALEGIGLGGRLSRYLSIRAVDDQGNVGPATTISTRDVLPGTPPELAGIAGQIDSCADRSAPRSSISKKGLTLNRKRVAVSGRSADRSCPGREAVATTVAISKREGKRCRFVKSDGRLSARRKCGQPIKLRTKAKFDKKTRKVSWSLKKALKIPRGRYRLRVTAADQSGNLERRTSRKNARSFSVR